MTQTSHKGFINNLIERPITIPGLTVILFLLFFLLGVIGIIPRDLVNRIFEYVGVR
jgi:hypothetical protein